MRESQSFADQKFPKAKNGLVFMFVTEKTIEDLGEGKPWKDRTSAIDNIQNGLNQLLNRPDQKNAFTPYASAFLGFMITFIKDINFKICLNSIQITNQLLVLDIVNLKKYY